MIEQYEKEAMKDLESFYGTGLQLTDAGNAWIAGYVQAKLRGQPPSSQIDWSNAPDWANYHAYDKDGIGFWYENLPQKTDKNWVNNTGKFDFSGYEIDWRTTLTRRPAEQLLKKALEMEQKRGGSEKPNSQCVCKQAEFTRDLDQDGDAMCGRCGLKI